MRSNPNIPSGRSSNPSAWSKRAPLMALAIFGFFVSMYLGLYQLNVFQTVWEPFFGSGTDAVIRSSFSRSLPIPDGLIGASGYLFDIILVSIGNNIRWKTKPWAVVLYSIVVGIMGLVSVLLITIQPAIVHAWCTLCLVSAVLSLSMVIPTMQELSASLQVLRKRR